MENKPALPKRAVGRPKGSKKIAPDDIDLAWLEQLAGHGLTVQQIADLMGIDRATFFEYQKSDPRIKPTVERGRVKALNDLINISFEAAKDPKNVGERLFWLKCRGGWREKQEIDLNHQYKPIVIQKVDGSTIELGRQDPQAEGDQDEPDSCRSA